MTRKTKQKYLPERIGEYSLKEGNMAKNQQFFSVRTAVMSLQNGWDSVRPAKEWNTLVEETVVTGKAGKSSKNREPGGQDT